MQKSSGKKGGGSQQRLRIVGTMCLTCIYIYIKLLNETDDRYQSLHVSSSHSFAWMLNHEVGSSIVCWCCCCCLPIVVGASLGNSMTSMEGTPWCASDTRCKVKLEQLNSHWWKARGEKQQGWRTLNICLRLPCFVSFSRAQNPLLAAFSGKLQILAPRLLQLVDKNFPELGCPDLCPERQSNVRYYSENMQKSSHSSWAQPAKLWAHLTDGKCIEFKMSLFHLSSSCFYPSSALRFLDELLFLRANRLSSLAAERLLNLSR